MPATPSQRLRAETTAGPSQGAEPVGGFVLMELDEILSALDRAAANLAKLERVWQRAAPFVPTGPILGCSDPEYDDLSRIWDDLLKGLPPIDGWTITDGLPEIEAIGQLYVDYLEIDTVPPQSVRDLGDQPGKDLAEYRYRLSRARRRAARERLGELVALVEVSLLHLLVDVDRKSRDRLEGPEVEQIVAAVAEIERLMGDTAQRRGRWGDLHRHLHFGEGHDWHDIHEFDWPSVRPDIDAAAFDDTEPLPVPDIDLGHAAGGHLTGRATAALPWDRLDDDGFERLLYDLLRDIPEHHNVQWLMQTRAPDRGRDLSLDRVLQDSTGSVRTERVIVQAKHWLRRSVRPTDVSGTLAGIKLWQPPVVRCLIIATSGRFSVDAVDWIERHNNTGDAPLVEMWPESRLETLLAQKPYLAAAHGLR